MCIHERQLLLKSFLFNYSFYFFADLSRFHCDIGCSLFLSGDHALGIYRHDLLIRRTVGNFLLGSDRAEINLVTSVSFPFSSTLTLSVYTTKRISFLPSENWFTFPIDISPTCVIRPAEVSPIVS